MIAEGVELVEDEDTATCVGFKCLDPDGHVVEVSWERRFPAAQRPPRRPIA
jgi:hypothetical protein